MKLFLTLAVILRLLLRIKKSLALDKALITFSVSFWLCRTDFLCVRFFGGPEPKVTRLILSNSLS